MASKDRFYYGWVVVASCVFIGIVTYGMRCTYGVFFKSLEQDFGWSRTMTSGVFSVYIVLCSVFAMVAGWALDHYGPRIIIAVTGFFAGLGLLLTSYASALWHFFITYSLLLGIGTGPTYTITMATATGWFTRRRGLALAIVGTGTGLGIIVMAPIAAHLISSYGWHRAYFILGLIAFFTIVPLALLLRKARARQAEAEQNDRHGSQDFSLLQAIKSRNFWLLFSIWLLYSFCLHLVLTHLVPHAIDSGISSIRAATILSLVGGISIPCRILLGRLSDTVGRKQIAVVSALLMSGAMLLLAAGSDLWILYLFTVVFGLGFGGVDPCVVALLGDVFDSRHIGVILGVLIVGYNTGAAVGPVLGGYSFDASGSYLYAFLGGAMAMLVATVLVLLVKSPSSRL